MLQLVTGDPLTSSDYDWLAELPTDVMDHDWVQSDDVPIPNVPTTEVALCQSRSLTPVASTPAVVLSNGPRIDSPEYIFARKHGYYIDADGTRISINYYGLASSRSHSHQLPVVTSMKDYHQWFLQWRGVPQHVIGQHVVGIDSITNFLPTHSGEVAINAITVPTNRCVCLQTGSIPRACCHNPAHYY